MALNQTEAQIQNILNMAQNDVAAPFLTTTNYSAGQYCSKDGKVYRRKTAGSGAWNASQWDEVVLADDMVSSKSPTAPTAYSSRATNIIGGYIQVGKLVFVSVSFTAANSQSSTVVYLQGLPNAATTITLTGGIPGSNASAFAFVNSSGQIGFGPLSQNAVATVSGVYMTA